MAFTDTVNEIGSLGGQSRNSFLGRLKEEFIPGWEDHVHTKVIISGLIAPKRGTMGGRRSLTSVMTAYPQSTGIALFEGDTLPTPSVGTYANPSIMARNIYSRLRWTGNVERAARKGDKVAWAGPRAEDLRTSRLQWELNFARMLYLGPEQRLAKIASVANNVLTLYGRDTRTSAVADLAKFGTHYLRQNMSVSHSAATFTDVLPDTNAGDQSADDESYISALNASTPSITILRKNGEGGGVGDSNGFPTLGVADQWIIPWRSRLDTVGSDDADYDSNFAGVNGLMNLCVNSTIKAYVYGLARSSYPTLSAQMVNNSGTVRPFNEDYISLGVDQIYDNGTGDEPDTILCHRSVRREFVKEVKGDRRFAEVQSKRGFGPKLQFISGDVPLPIVTDRDCMPGVMWVLESEGFGWFSESEMQMVDDGERFVANQDAHEIVMHKSGNLATKKPHNNAMIDDIQYSTSGLTDL